MSSYWVPQFLARGFEWRLGGQSKMMEDLSAFPNTMAAMPGFEAMRKQQEVFMQAFMGGIPGWGGSGPAKDEAPAEAPSKDAELAQIKQQLAELQKKLSKL